MSDASPQTYARGRDSPDQTLPNRAAKKKVKLAKKEEPANPSAEAQGDQTHDFLDLARAIHNGLASDTPANLTDVVKNACSASFTPFDKLPTVEGDIPDPDNDQFHDFRIGLDCPKGVYNIAAELATGAVVDFYQELVRRRNQSRTFFELPTQFNTLHFEDEYPAIDPSLIERTLKAIGGIAEPTDHSEKIIQTLAKNLVKGFKIDPAFEVLVNDTLWNALGYNITAPAIGYSKLKQEVTTLREQVNAFVHKNNRLRREIAASKMKINRLETSLKKAQGL
ncbi:MAG: hypothetical protein VW104_02170 [Halieaceae bacterium]